MTCGQLGRSFIENQARIGKRALVPIRRGFGPLLCVDVFVERIRVSESSSFFLVFDPRKKLELLRKDWIVTCRFHRVASSSLKGCNQYDARNQKESLRFAPRPFLIPVGNGSLRGRLKLLQSGPLKELRPIVIGKQCIVGQKSLLGAGAVLEDGASIGLLTNVPAGTHVKSEQVRRTHTEILCYELRIVLIST